MTIIKLTAQQIAESQLNAAFSAWSEKDYIAAITLAGAAEEILGKKLRKLGLQPAYDRIKSEIVTMVENTGASDSEVSDADGFVARMLNNTKNELKHCTHEGELEFDLREDAIEMIERATVNFNMLNNTYPEWIMDFWASSS